MKKPKKPGYKFIPIDKKYAAIHEAGHAVVALDQGAPYAHLTLERDHTRNLETERAFRAQCRAGKLKGILKPAARSYAGVLAEMLYEDFDTDEMTAWEYLDVGICSASPTDMIAIAYLSPSWRVRAIRLSLKILKDNWKAVRGVAFELHDNYRGDVIFAAPFLVVGVILLASCGALIFLPEPANAQGAPSAA